MKFKIKSIQIEIEWLFVTLFFISIFSIKIRNYLMSYYACYLFIAFHEISHILIASIFDIKLKKIKLKKIKFSTMGLNVNFYDNLLNSNINKFKKIIIFMAGPLSNILFAVIFSDIKMVFEINIFLAILNLMPIFPLDGYNILKLLSKDEIRKYINKFIKIIAILFILLGIIQIMLYKIPSILMFSMYIILINKKAKINV